MSVVDTILDAVARRTRALASGVRFGQFASVGVVGAVLDTTITLTLSGSMGLNPDLSKFIGAEAAILLMFLVNEHWTFADQGEDGFGPMGRRLVTSNVVRGGGLAVQLVTYHVVRQFAIDFYLLGVDLYDVVAIGIAIGAGFIVNYLAESLVTWQVHK